MFFSGITVSTSVVQGGDETLPPFTFTDISYTRTSVTSETDPASQETVNDAVINVTPLANRLVNAQVYIIYEGHQDGDITWESSNPAIATVDSKGFCTHISDGLSSISAHLGGESISVIITFETVHNEERTLDHYLDGTLGKHISDTVDDAISGLDPASTKELFTTQNHETGEYTRNPDVWCDFVGDGLGCFSPYNSTGGATRAGTLISPLHIVFATHYQIAVGATVRFVKYDGTVINRILVAKIWHNPPTGVAYDMTVGLLSEPILDIPVASILPSDWFSYLPSMKVDVFDWVNFYAQVPSLGLDQEEHASIQEAYTLDKLAGYVRPSNTERLGFYEEKIDGDSGNPAFLIVNDELVLLSIWTGAGSGTFYTYWKSWVNQTMIQLGGSYQLTEVDLSGFLTYEV